MKQFLIKIINWHLLPLPKDIPILSFYEFIAYFAILSYVIWLYNKVQIIPVFDETIYTKTIIESPKDDVKTVIEYHIPMTFTFIKENEDSIYNSGSTDGFVSVFFEMKEEAEIREDGERRSSITPDATRDSLKSIYLALLDTVADNNYDVLYVKTENINTWKKPRKETLFTPWRNLVEKSGFCYGQSCAKENTITSECFLTKTPSVRFSSSATNSPYSRPQWKRLYDISQSYFNLKMEGDSFDGIFTIDFIGATEFSQMNPQPDVITYSSITFKDAEKIKYISEHGLRFHAKFIEIEGLQRSRLFAITSVGAALIAIFITFLVLALYKSIKKIQFRKKHYERSSDTI